MKIQWRNKTSSKFDSRAKLAPFEDDCRSITSAYYRGAQGILLVFDITDFKSFTNIKTWLNEIKTHASSSVVTLLVGSKSDLAPQRAVTQTQAETYAREVKIEYLEGSAKTGQGIEAVFSRLIKMVTDQLKASGSTARAKPDERESTSLLSSKSASAASTSDGCEC